MEKSSACGFHCIKMQNIGVKFGQDEILKDVSIHIHCGELTVLIGKNGAGKSTLLKAILGEIKHTGTIEFFNQKDEKYQNLKIGYVPQSIHVERHMPTTVYDGRHFIQKTYLVSKRQEIVPRYTKTFKHFPSTKLY